MASATSAGVAALAPEMVALSWSRIGDDAVLLAVSRDGERRALETGRTKAVFGEDALAAAAARLAGATPIAGRELLIDYDSYYPNHHQSRIDKPLPVLRVDLADAGGSSLYIDPVDGRLLAKIDASRRVYRWLYCAEARRASRSNSISTSWEGVGGIGPPPTTAEKPENARPERARKLHVFAFIAPGLIVSYVRARFINGRMEKLSDSALAYLALAVVHHGLTLPLLDYVVDLPAGLFENLCWRALNGLPM